MHFKPVSQFLMQWNECSTIFFADSKLITYTYMCCYSSNLDIYLDTLSTIYKLLRLIINQIINSQKFLNCGNFNDTLRNVIILLKKIQYYKSKHKIWNLYSTKLIVKHFIIPRFSSNQIYTFLNTNHHRLSSYIILNFL